MCDIIEVIEADRLHITRWAARLGELSRQDNDQESGPVLIRTWQTLASLIELHMHADEEIWGPAFYPGDAPGRALAREIRDAYEDIREIIRETSLQPPGSSAWWDLAGAALAAWTVQLDMEARGPLAERRRRADPALRERLAGQWRAFTEAHIRDQYPQAPPDIPTHQLRHDSYAPATVPQLADPAFGPLACTCRACTRTLDSRVSRRRGHVRQQPVAAEDGDASGNQPSPDSRRPARSDPAGWPARRLWVLGLAASFIVAAIDAVLGHQAILIGLLIIGPCCVSLTGRWVLTGLTGLWVIGLAVTLSLPDDIWGSAIFFTWLVVVVAVALVSTAAAASIHARGLVRLR